MGKIGNTFGDPYTVTITRQEHTTFVVWGRNLKEATRAAKEVIGNGTPKGSDLYRAYSGFEDVTSHGGWKFDKVVPGDVGSK